MDGHLTTYLKSAKMGSVKHVRKLIGNKDFPTFTTGHPISGRSQIQTKLLIILILVCFIFFKNFRYNIANVFWVLLFLKNADKMCGENLVSVSIWLLCTGYPAIRLSSHSVLQASIFFLWRYLKGKLKILKNFSISEMQ